MVDEVCQASGFQRIGALTNRLNMSIWWHPAPAHLELLCLDLGKHALIKGTKTYSLRSIGQDAQTWARDIPALHDYLESHFPELRLSLSFFRDIPPALAQRRAQASRTNEHTNRVVTVDDLAQLQRERTRQDQQVRSLQRLTEARSHRPTHQVGHEAPTTGSDVLEQHLQNKSRSLHRTIESTDAQISQVQDELSLISNLQREYQRKGSALALTISISSNLHMASCEQEAHVAVMQVRKELEDAHRYQITQKLSGSRLRIQIAEATEPQVVWIEQWFGGGLNPTQLERLAPDLEPQLTSHLDVTPDEDIRLNGHVHTHQKRIAPRVVSAMFDRLDRTEQLTQPTKPRTRRHQLSLGRIMHQDTLTDEPALVSLDDFRNSYISGATGSGKSYCTRVVVEEASQHADLGILVLDPRNQWVGILAPEDRSEITDRYETFGIEGARGFPFQYLSVSHHLRNVQELDARQLIQGRHVISLRSLDDRDRCANVAEILERVFDELATEESDTVRLLLLIEEAQLFTKRHTSSDAKDAAERVERALERCFREGRKYGLCTIVVSQSIKDFSHGLVAVRQNANTRIFFQNADRELEYARDYVEQPRQLTQLPPGVALVCNPSWGMHKVAIRPPMSKVWEFTDQATRVLLNDSMSPKAYLSDDARSLLKVITRDSGEQPMNVSQLSDLSGISSKRRLNELLAELEHAGAIRTRQIRQRGRPRVIEIIDESPCLDAPNGHSTPSDATRT